MYDNLANHLRFHMIQRSMLIDFTNKCAILDSLPLMQLHCGNNFLETNLCIYYSVEFDCLMIAGLMDHSLAIQALDQSIRRHQNLSAPLNRATMVTMATRCPQLSAMGLAMIRTSMAVLVRPLFQAIQGHRRWPGQVLMCSHSRAITRSMVRWLATQWGHRILPVPTQCRNRHLGQWEEFQKVMELILTQHMTTR